MTRAELAQGSATFLVVIVAGFLSESYLDRHLVNETDKKAASSASAETTSAETTSAETTSSAACVGTDGSWKNWPWSNVPILSPKCREER